MMSPKSGFLVRMLCQCNTMHLDDKILALIDKKMVWMCMTLKLPLAYLC
jgi:hypothetical protein